MPPRAASLHARSAVKALALSEQRDIVGDPARTIVQKRKGAPRVAEDNGALVEYLRQEVQKRKKAAATPAPPTETATCVVCCTESVELTAGVKCASGHFSCRGCVEQLLGQSLARDPAASTRARRSRSATT